MGKIRIKTFGDEDQEKKEQKNKARQEARKDASVKTVDSTTSEEQTSEKGEKTARVRRNVDSKRHKANSSMYEDKSDVALTDALKTLKSFKPSKFDETVELHINVTEKGISGQVDLPHGTGKKLKIKVADEALIESISKGVIDFDILVAKPEIMPQLAKVARILGPRGLMPNPKAGTVTPNPEEAIKKLSSGQVSYKTESQSPIIHMSVGKISFDAPKLEENIKTVLTSIGSNKIKSITLKSTMSPGVKFSVK